MSAIDCLNRYKDGYTVLIVSHSNGVYDAAHSADLEDLKAASGILLETFPKVLSMAIAGIDWKSTMPNDGQADAIEGYRQVGPC